MSAQQDKNNQNTIYVSKRHYRRKQKIEDYHKRKMKDTMENSGIIALIMMYVWDAFVEIFVGLVFDLFDIMFFAFDYTYLYVFGNYNGIIPDADKNGMRFSYKTFRYALTLILPPIGVLMGKGLFGWFNVLITMILCYVSYPIGIVYAFIITADNRYADRFERVDINRIKKLQEENRTDDEEKSDRYALLGTASFIILFVVIFISFLTYF